MTKKTIDPVAAMGAVVREVANVEKDGKAAQRVRATRVYEAPIADVWDAITSAERIPRWFLPIEGDLRVGGKYQLVGNAGGDIVTCDPPRHLAITWGMHGDASWVEVRLVELHAERTRLELEHTASVPEEMRKKYGPGGVGIGWDLCLLGLEMHLESGASITEEGKAWAASEDGKVFVRGASERWGEASIGAGTDPAEARAAATATTGFYTGET